MSEISMIEAKEDVLPPALVESENLFAAEHAARLEAERVGRLKDEFLATLSHELRTPLMAISGWAQVLAREPLSDTVREGIEVIARNARTQTRIIEDLLDMSRIISGKIRLDIQPLDLAKIMSDSLETIRATAEARSVRLISEIDSAAGASTGDPSRIQQVFWNLLSNAVKFTPPGGTVRVAVTGQGTWFEITVSDDGEGIDPELLRVIFDRFRQEDNSQTRQHGGLGLGLAIAKQLVELHGGKISVRSEGKGRGASFTIRLPRGEGAPRSSARTQEKHAHSGVRGVTTSAYAYDLHGLRVLVVDDEPDSRLVIRRVLENGGATVVDAESADEAVRVFESQKPDLIVSDVGMPGKSGFEMIRACV